MRTLFYSILFSQCLLVAASAYGDTNPWKESYRLENQYQYDAALSALNHASGDDELLLLRRGWLNYLKGSNSKAIEYYKKAISKNGNSLDARLGIILPLLAQQRWREAEQNANNALSIAPWNYYAHIRLMQAEQGLKQWQQLAKHAQTVHTRYPSDATVLIYLAHAQQRLGNHDAAKAAYQKVLQLLPDNFEASQYAK